VAIGGNTYTVIQEGVPCVITRLTPPSQSVPVTGGDYTFGVTVTPQDCGWHATATSGITITSGGGTGSGTVAYTVSANTTGKRLVGSVNIILVQGGEKAFRAAQKGK
jgi:hypothetical protein